MIEFMVLAAPRSGTAWAANWLTTDTTLCLHDPIAHMHYTEMDAIESKKTLGISCTGTFLFPDWVNRHPARKVILHRPLDEVNRSLLSLGAPTLSKEVCGLLDSIEGEHHDWRDLFDNPRGIYEFLTGKEFDAERHAELSGLQVQVNFAVWKPDNRAVSRMIHEIRSRAS